jgi:Macrocin-O-methyltransferase (TylF)/Transposase
METSEFTQEQIIDILRRHSAGMPAEDIYREYSISSETLSSWASKFRIADMNGTPTASQSKIRKLLRKTPPQIVASIRWHVNSLVQGWIRKAFFGIVSWMPRGSNSCFLAYYPPSVSSFPERVDLYRRWIRGNKINNNGDASRFMGLMLNLRQLLNEEIDGDFAELGVWKGNSAAILAEYAAQSGKRLFLFDTFSGFDRRDLIGDDKGKKLEFDDTSVDFVRETTGHDEIITCIKGFFPESITPEVTEQKFALVHLDCDLYMPMKAALEFFYPRMPKGGMMILHDYSSGCWEGATRAIDHFCKATGEHVALWPDKSGTAMIRKSR